MDRLVTEIYLLDWDETDVHTWLSSLGLPYYERQIRENSIRGDSLCCIDIDSLKGLGVKSIGQRLSILKAIYNLKLSQSIPISPDDYIPPSQVEAAISINDLTSDLKSQAERLRVIDENTRTIKVHMKAFLEDLTKFRESLTSPSQETLVSVNATAPPKIDLESVGQASLEAALDPSTQAHTPESTKSADTPDDETAPLTKRRAPYKAGTLDPTWKILPAALKKMNISEDLWPLYELHVEYGPPNNRVKRLFEENDKPLVIFEKLKNSELTPIFTLLKRRPTGTPPLVAVLS